jgi:hypothetical protein
LAFLRTHLGLSEATDVSTTKQVAA